MRELQDYSERMMRAAIRELPDGVYRFERFPGQRRRDRPAGVDPGGGHDSRRFGGGGFHGLRSRKWRDR